MALSIAHNLKIVHRDVKPANLLIGSDGLVKVSDFGLATRRGRGAVGGHFTPMYAAPEQCEGQEDHRVDIFSLGRTLTCLVTGNPMDRAAVEKMVDFPESIRSAVLKALSPDPNDRPENMDAFLDLLPPPSHNRVGTPEAVSFCQSRKLRPAKKSDHREFIFDLGDIRDSVLKKRRTILGYGIEPAKNTAFYIIRRHETGVISTKHAYKGNAEYGKLIGFDRSEMAQLIELPS